MKNLTDLYLKIIEAVNSNQYILVESSQSYPAFMDERGKTIYLAEDYLLYLFLIQHSTLDKTKISPIIKIEAIERDKKSQVVISSSTFRDLTSIISPEAEKSTKWSILEEDMNQEQLSKEIQKVKENKQALSNTNLEINQYGAVYTNPVLIDHIYKVFDEYYQSENKGKSFFANPEHTICDPASGSGSFLLCAKQYLVDNQPQATEEAVVNNQLFGSEIQKKQLLISEKVLNYKNREDVKPNLHLGNSLLFDFWGKKFDLVPGNPPYQGMMEDGSKRSNHSLWEEFILKGLEITKDDGYLVLIVPTSWMSPAWKHMETVFRSNRIVHLEINTIGTFFPGIGSKFSWFILQKRPPTPKDKTTIISNFGGEVSQFKTIFNSLILSNVITKESQSIFNKFYKTENTFSFKRDSSLHMSNVAKWGSKTPAKGLKYPIKHTNIQTFWSKDPHKNQHQKKLLIARSGKPIPELDKGKYGTTESYLFSEVSDLDEGNRKLLLLNSKVFRFVFETRKFSGFNTPQVFTKLPYIELDDYSDESLYKELGLTNSEILLIERTVSK